MAERCRNCGARIHWLRQADIFWTQRIGARANPIDPEPNAEIGRLILNVDKGLYRFATGNEKQMHELYGKPPLFISHFETCPEMRSRKNAERHPLFRDD